MRARVSRRACRNCSSACDGQVRDPLDLTMRGHMPNRPGHYERRAQRGRRLGSLLLLSGVPSAMTLIAAASFSYAGLIGCAQTEGVKVGTGTSTTATASEGTVSATSEARCGAGGIECGAKGMGCCPAGDTCTADGSCVPAASCTTNQDCSSDSVCGGGSCKPWSSFPAQTNFDFACRSGVDLPSLQPQVQCRWGDTPPSEFPDSVQVIGTPMVVDFDYDNNPETIHPSIVFVSYEAGGLASPNGVLRVINGRTCAPEFSDDGGSNPFIPDVAPALGDVD